MIYSVRRLDGGEMFIEFCSHLIENQCPTWTTL